MPKTIEITISPTGETTVTTKGYAGSACRNGSKFIEDALGTRTAEKLTPEFSQPAIVQQQVKQ